MIKCDRIQLTAMLASRNYQDLLFHFLTALENAAASDQPSTETFVKNLTVDKET